MADELESLLVGSDQTAAKRPGMFINGHLFLQVDPAPLFCFNSNRFESKLPEILKVFKTEPPLNHVTTFGGHPVSSAAAHANLKVLLSDDFSAKALKIEEIAREILKGPGIRELRGRGAMLGLQLESSSLAEKTVADCFRQGLILGWTLHSDSLIRIAPPLIIEEALLRESLHKIKNAILRSLD